MESIARPMRGLQEEVAWFARATEIKLLHVTTDASLRGTVLDMVMSHEHSAYNRALFFRFDDPMVEPDRGWSARVQRLRDQVADKTEAIKPAGIELRPLGDVAGAGRGTSAEFSAILMKLATVLVAPLTGVVAVLAPTQVEDPLLFLQEITSLVTAPRLGHVRFIVVEVDGDAVAPLIERLGSAALSCPCVTDDAAGKDDLRALGATTAAEPVLAQATAVTPVGWRAPGATPDVVPPPRVGAPTLPSDEELRAEGLSPNFVKGGGDQLKRLLLGGSLAMREGRPIEAVTLQARAAALCAEMEMPREQIINLHVLGGYLIAAASRERAREIYVKAADIARTHALPELESQCELALGMLDVVDKRAAQAATHYAAAGRLAEAAKVDPLAMECWRMAGQLALEAKLEPSAVECWKRALSLAEPLDPAVAKLTSAPETARALAALCRRRGLTAQANALEQRSMELEQGTGPAATPTAAASSS